MSLFEGEITVKENEKWKVDRAKEVVRLLHTGVLDKNDQIRDFNIVDYYKITNISPKTLYERTSEYLKEDFTELELKKFYSFVLKSLNDKKLTVKAIMEVKHSVLVNDQIREVTDFDKNIVINYLHNNKLPLTADVYALTLRDYLSAKFSIEEFTPKNKTSIK